MLLIHLVTWGWSTGLLQYVQSKGNHSQNIPEIIKPDDPVFPNETWIKLQAQHQRHTALRCKTCNNQHTQIHASASIGIEYSISHFRNKKTHSHFESASLGFYLLRPWNSCGRVDKAQEPAFRKALGEILRIWNVHVTRVNLAGMGHVTSSFWGKDCEYLCTL